MQEPIFAADYPDFTEYGPTPCSESYPDSFFAVDPMPGIITHKVVYRYEREAKMTCVQCPYQQRCLTYALKHPDEQGIWGGTTEKQRAAMRRGKLVSLGVPKIKPQLQE